MISDQQFGFFLLAGEPLGASVSLSSLFIFFAIVGSLLLLALAVAAFALLRQQLRHLSSQLGSGDKHSNHFKSELESQALIVRQMSLEIEDLKTGLTNRGKPPALPEPLWASAGMPINLNRRGQIIQLARKGKSVTEIATDLHVAQGEVELLLKIHDLSQPS